MLICSGLYRLRGGGGGRTTSKPKSGYPSRSAEVETFHSLRRRKNRKCSELKMFSPRVYFHATTGPHLDDTSEHFKSKKSSFFLFLDQNSQKVDLKVFFSFSKNTIIFNDLLAGASEHKSEKFFLSSNL
jgi:hypothetical protein